MKERYLIVHVSLGMDVGIGPSFNSQVFIECLLCARYTVGSKRVPIFIALIFF